MCKNINSYYQHGQFDGPYKRHYKNVWNDQYINVCKDLSYFKILHLMRLIPDNADTV